MYKSASWLKQRISQFLPSNASRIVGIYFGNAIWIRNDHICTPTFGRSFRYIDQLWVMERCLDFVEHSLTISTTRSVKGG